MNFEKLLSGGDLRKTGNVNQVIGLVNNQANFDQLLKLLFHTDRSIIMRAADAIEKITRTKPVYLRKHKSSILQLCDKAHDKELKWHLALLIPRFTLSISETEKVWALLMHWAMQKNESKIVRVNSVQGLFNLLPQNAALTGDFNLLLKTLEAENIPSLNARIKRLRGIQF